MFSRASYIFQRSSRVYQNRSHHHKSGSSSHRKYIVLVSRAAQRVPEIIKRRRSLSVREIPLLWRQKLQRPGRLVLFFLWNNLKLRFRARLWLLTKLARRIRRRCRNPLSSSPLVSVLQTLIHLREKVSCLERRPPRALVNCTSGRSPLPPIISGGETASSRSPLRPHRTVVRCAKGRGLYHSIRCFRASAWPQDKERFRMFLRLTRCNGTLAGLFHANQSCARLNIPGDASIIPTLRGVL